MRGGEHNAGSFALGGIEVHHGPRAGWNFDNNWHMHESVFEFARLTQRDLELFRVFRFHLELNIRSAGSADNQVRISMSSLAALHTADVQHALLRVPS